MCVFFTKGTTRNKYLGNPLMALQRDARSYSVRFPFRSCDLPLITPGRRLSTVPQLLWTNAFVLLICAMDQDMSLPRWKDFCGKLNTV
jgi:hypothetical protein